MRVYTEAELRAFPGIVRCAKCGERTTLSKESSFYGHVHLYGPVGHHFTPRPATDIEAAADKEREAKRWRDEQRDSIRRSLVKP